jgi:hypothetical protein
LLGVVGTTGIAALLPREAQALTSVPMGPAPQPNSVLPDLGAPADGEIEPGELEDFGDQDELGELDEGVELANHRWDHRRRRVRRWRRRCRRRWINGHLRRRCRREPYFVWFWFGI